jgi:Protein of unknown function (DUF1648).
MKYFKGIMALLPLVITAAVLPFMPERVPMHYDINGAVDRMGSRYELLLMPLLIILILAVSALAMHHYAERAKGPEDDRDAKAARANIKSLRITTLAVPLIFGVLQCYILYMTYQNATAKSVKVDSMLIVRVAYILIGIMCIVFGNLMPRTERNNVFGFRTSWSMYNDNTWRKCNRLGGIFFIVIGLLMIVTAAVVPPMASTFLVLGYLLVGTVILIFYSHKVYKEEKALESQPEKK